MAGAATSIIFVTTKFDCRSKTFVVTNMSLLQQNIRCDKHVIAVTNICHDNHVFCCDKNIFSHTSVVTKDMFCCDKHVFGCDNHAFVVTKLFVVTKMVLAAAATNGNGI